MVRTQVYLTKRQHRALKKAAREEGLSMTEMLRRILDTHLEERSGLRSFKKEGVMSFIGLGSSGRRDIAANHDRALDEAARGGALR
jgi:Ribbon-helix-helix protein, copG family